MRSFLGLTSYYRKFVKDYAKLAKPLYELTKPNVPWCWTETCEKALAYLKEKLTTAPILAYPLFVCVEVLRPIQPNGAMSSAVNLPSHTFTGQA